MRPPRILVVDDDADTRELYVEYLTLSGFDATSAADGPTALEVARRERPTLVTIDVSLPGMDGCEVTRILKSDPLTRDIIVFALTGRVEPRYRDEAARAGCDLFIAKPCLPGVLLEQILRALDRNAAEGGSLQR